MRTALFLLFMVAVAFSGAPAVGVVLGVVLFLGLALWK